MAVRRPVRLGGAPADDPEDVLSSSPFERDVQDALDAAPTERARPSLTILLVGGLLLAAGFVGGIEANKRWGPPGEASPGPAAAGAGARYGAGAPPGGAFPGSGSQTAGTTVGTVKVVSGDTVYVQTTDGSVVTVETSGSTRIRVSRAGKASDLKPGSAVSVQGSGDSSGKITATSITQGESRR